MFEAQIKKTEPMTVAYVKMHGPYDQVPDGYRRLYEWVDEHELQPIGMPQAVYLTTPDVVPMQEAAWELLAPVAPTQARIESGEDFMGIKTIAEQTVASAMHRGSYDSVEETYEALGQWIVHNGYTIVGPPREIYYSDPEVTPTSETLTEVVFPVERTT